MGSVSQNDPPRKSFYVYVLCRPDGRPFYVGKGNGNRIDNHEVLAARGKRGRRFNVIRKIWRNGGQVFKMKVFHTYDEDAAYAMEQQLIAAIGREHLTNETGGGNGNYMWHPSVEWHAKVQAAKIGKPRSEACKQKIRERLAGRTLPPEHVEAAAAGHRGQKRSEQARRNIGDGQRGKPKPGLQGEKHFRAKLNTQLVRELRRLKRTGRTYTSLSEEYGIARNTLIKAVSGYTWAHVTEEE